MNYWTAFKWFWRLLGISLSLGIGIMIGAGEWSFTPVFTTIVAMFCINMSFDAKEHEQKVKRP